MEEDTEEDEVLSLLWGMFFKPTYQPNRPPKPTTPESALPMTLSPASQLYMTNSHSCLVSTTVSPIFQIQKQMSR